ncbi:hypothetical protein CEXT_106361 [Caerostris extrusa]|uniref:Uncharacterized protein n=1 Tax=Caerostris extrusa TaxID=172846 RepID=A0AAV4VME6_CAEEX|nr:hypothetical protein CEXT_106361 [Caerostris extrusa]
MVAGKRWIMAVCSDKMVVRKIYHDRMQDRIRDTIVAKKWLEEDDVSPLMGGSAIRYSMCRPMHLMKKPRNNI